MQKTEDATGNLIGNKFDESVAKSYDGGITKVSRPSPQNISKVKNEHDKEIPKERYKSPKY